MFSFKVKHIAYAINGALILSTSCFLPGLPNALAGILISMNGKQSDVENKTFDGLITSGEGSNITGRNITVLTPSLDYKSGAIATDKSQISLTDGSVTTLGKMGAGLVASGNGSTISTTGTTLDIRGDGTKGAMAQSAATITLNGGSIKTAGVMSNGLHAFGAGSSVKASDVDIATGGKEAYGAAAYQGGKTVVSGGSIKTTGEKSRGVHVSDANSSIEIADASIETTSQDSYGVAAYQSGKLIINGGHIKTANLNSHGIAATDTGSSAEVANTAIEIIGNKAVGAAALDNAKVTIRDSSIKTAGEEGVGVLAKDNSASIETFNVNTETTGKNSYGAVAYKSGKVIINDGTIKTFNTRGYGVGAADEGSSVSATNAIIETKGLNSAGAVAGNKGEVTLIGGSITTTGEIAHGLGVYNGGQMIVTGTQIQTEGENSAVIYANRDTLSKDNNVSTISITDSTLISSQGNIMASNGAALDVTFNNVITPRSGTDLLINAFDADPGEHGVVNFAAKNSSLYGNIIAAPENVVSIRLEHSTLTGAALNATNMALEQGGVWTVTDNSSVSQSVSNAGTLAFSPPTGGQFKTLTTQNYTGNNGTLIFNTLLGDDKSQTDRLVITGDSAGSSSVQVNKAGGNGAQTVEGIELISVGGKSEGIFTKSGRIAAGAYDYDLVKKNKNWYLTSTQANPVDPGISEEKPIIPADPATPIPPVSPLEPARPTEHIFLPEAGSYAANMLAANTLFTLSLHDRLGETQYTDVLTGEKKVTSMWLRNQGGHQRSQMADGQNKTQANRYVVQLGADIAQWSSDGLNRYHLGVMSGYANQKSHTHSSVTGYGSRGNIDGYSTGIYGTWYANAANKSGLYMDGWLQYQWFNNEVNGDNLDAEKYKSRGFTASLASGYSFLLGESKSRQGMTRTFWLQPQAEITWMGVKAKEHIESNGTRVQGDGQNNIRTRLGVKAYLKGHSAIDEGKDRTFQPFVEANWLHNSKNFGVTLDDTRVSMAGTRHIGEIKTGVEGQLGNNLNLWANIGQQMGDKGYSDTQAALGVKYLF
ncbi:autotransporter outer membrane beta-barrel domain-containing protein [Serratia liquefaciens]|uniref:autotransporter outer membrane beta-barrel domain-containing protein n=1 Tax=Serratia liquefaciens TaxID=614 RepID=UPI0022B9A777|nr:autotransporter outer membrane beta-barrel domain-containing protein [Serratia liquefaciens]